MLYESKWIVTSLLMAGLVFYVTFFMSKKEVKEWGASTWSFAWQILPLLLAGVFVAGLLLGRVDHEGLVPSEWVSSAVGGNSLASNFSLLLLLVL